MGSSGGASSVRAVQVEATSVSTDSGYALTMLRGWRLTCNGCSVQVAKPAQRLIALIALAGTHEPRYLSGTLWPDSSERQAQANLRSTLSRLQCSGIPVVHRDHGLLALDDGLSVDVHRLRRCAELVMREPTVAPPAEVLTVLVRAGDLLAGWYEDWVLTWRERLRAVRVHALESAAFRLAQAGRFAEAVDAALLSVNTEPLRESAHRALMEVHIQEGNTLAAVRQFYRYRELLRHELGVEPSLEMRQLLPTFHPPVGMIDLAAARSGRRPGR